MDSRVTENISQVLQYALDNNGNINDSIKLSLAPIVGSFYQANNYINIWSKNENWTSIADSLYNFIEGSENYGLYPGDYHYEQLRALKNNLSTDSLARMDAKVWIQAELMLSDAFMRITKHLKQGRLMPDSISFSADSTCNEPILH